MATTNYLKQLVESDTTVVFTFGYTGAGKTTLLVALYEYLFNYCFVQLNSKGNQEGANFLIECSGELRDEGKLPPLTTTLTIKEVDWICEINKIRTMLTFLDMAGEDLKMANPREINSFTTKKSTGVLDEEIVKYLRESKLSIILLCVIDYERIKKDNELISTFFNYIRTYFPNFSFASAAIIVTKWDKHNGGRSGSDVISYIRQNAHATYVGINDLVESPCFFPFSIGKISDADKRIVEELDLSYCPNILEWLHYVSLNAEKNTEDSSDDSIIDFIKYCGQRFKEIFSFFRS